MNKRFTRASFRRMTPTLGFEYERRVSNNYLVRFENRLFQMLQEQGDRPQPGKQVTVKKKRDGTTSIHWKEKPLKIKEILPNKEVKQPVSNAA